VATLAPSTDVNHIGAFAVGPRQYRFYSVRSAVGDARFSRLPYAARVLAENVLRNIGRPGVTAEVLDRFVASDTKPDSVALPLHIPRIILPDSSGIPVLMDLAALQSAVAQAGHDPALVRSAVPMTLIVDHSLQVDAAGSADAARVNLRREFERNHERYRFLKWAQAAFPNLEIYPPGSGIIHQVHLEQVAAVTLLDEARTPALAYPDLVIGGDSHTPMVNGLGVVGWGVGGIEAESVALGEPYVLPKPEFVGVRLEGRPLPGVTFTDIVLRLTERLRKSGVVGAFIEFFGPGCGRLTVPDRATLANMSPEYGATCAFWPIDEQTLAYLRLTGRPETHVALVAAHARASGLFRSPAAPDPAYDRIIEVDLSAGGRAIAGPAHPHNRQVPGSVASSFLARHPAPGPDVQQGSEKPAVPHGAVAIAAITSCTNTANPRSMIGAGLFARNALERGLSPAPWVKTSFAPGSRAVTTYLERAGLLASLEALGFHVVGYGCTTCGGKSGPLKPEVAQSVERQGASAVAVLSGNRNFDGRIHRLVAASYLCAPALVIAYALAGRITIDIETDVIAADRAGAPVRLADLWPSDTEVEELVERCVTPDVFATRTGADGAAAWAGIDAPEGLPFSWDPASGYIVEPPFFRTRDNPFATGRGLAGARVLGIYDDNLTTDHISPGGEIPPESPAGRYLQERGIPPAEFNTYVGRRGNHDVMVRGTFGNVRIRNKMTPGREGWWTRFHPGAELMTVFDAAERYARDGTPLIVLGGSNFGAGSSRDWATKGPALLGVCAVLARSFERIHRSNLIGVGIVPLLFSENTSVECLRLDGSELVSFAAAEPGKGFPTEMTAVATRSDGARTEFPVRADIRSEAEADLLLRGGMFAAALERIVGDAEAAR
jgi:aconitate hydratase